MDNLSTKITPILDKDKYLRIIKEALGSTRTIDTENLSTHDWLSIRVLLGIGASEVAAILGINPYSTPFAVWQTKVADEITEIDNDIMLFGNLVEPTILKYYEIKTGFKVRKDNKIHIHKEYDCLFANLDGVYIDGTNGTVECKSTVYSVYKNWANDEENCVNGIPLYYYCQIQHELSVTGFDFCDLAILITDKRELKIHRIIRDEEYIKKQNEFLVKWWDYHVIGMIPPELTAKEYNFIEPFEGSFIEANPETLEFIGLLKTRKETLKGLEKEIEHLENKIKLFLGDNELLTSGGSSLVTWKTQERKSIDSKKLKETLPEIYTQYEKTSTFRVFKIK